MSGDERRSDGGDLLATWSDAVCDELGLAGPVDRRLVLDLAREVAHGVARPAAPLTAYLLGLAVGAGVEPADAAARINRLVRARSSERSTG